MKKRYLFIVIAMITMCVCGCGNKSQEVPEVGDDGEDNIATVEVAEPEAVPEPVEEEQTIVEEDAETEEEKEKFGEGYAYVLEMGDHPFFAFNSPYRPASISKTECRFDNNRNDNEMYLIVSIESGYEITESGKYKNRSSDMYDIVQSEDFETIYGNVTIHFMPMVIFSGERGAEIAQVEINDLMKATIILYYTSNAHYGNSYEATYQGKLKELLPIILEPIDGKGKELTLQDNNVSVDTAYDIYLCEPDTGNESGGYKEEEMKPVLGIKLDQLVNDNWADPRVHTFVMGGAGYKDGSSEVTHCISCYSWNYSSNAEGEIKRHLEISTSEIIYNYYFGEQSLFNVEEKAEVDTPFGKAKIYYAETEMDGEKIEEEIAVLKNLENAIVINYWEDGYQSPYVGTYREDFEYNTYDGDYDGKLEELIPQMF